MSDAEQLLASMATFQHQFNIPWPGENISHVKNLLETEVGVQAVDWQWMADPMNDFCITIGMNDAILAVQIKLMLS